MLLRNSALLLLCVSVGMCATLGHYHSQAKEEEAVVDAAVDAAAVDPVLTGGVVAADPEAVDLAADRPSSDDDDAVEEHEDDSTIEPTDAQGDDSLAAEESVADPLAADELVANAEAAVNSAAEEPKAEVPEAAEDPETDADTEMSHVLAADDPDVEALADEGLVQERLSEEDNEVTTIEASSWTISSIRGSFQSLHGYFCSLVELVGGHNGMCQYRCRHGKLPQPRPGYQLPEPNGCSSSLVGFQFDLGIPAMTNCCNHLDVCYDTCGTSKDHCDSKFRFCLHDICSDLKKSLGFESKGETCESVADGLYNTVWTLGCRPYMNSQRAACFCEEEEKEEL
ncbi:hypothetical protein LDENG_00264730 [Lucifuga dentata]|nr:hypothetical protein LDENG_00264730 [Lucifuga dentata]